MLFDKKKMETVDTFEVVYKISYKVQIIGHLHDDVTLTQYQNALQISFLIFRFAFVGWQSMLVFLVYDVIIQMASVTRKLPTALEC